MLSARSVFRAPALIGRGAARAPTRVCSLHGSRDEQHYTSAATLYTGQDPDGSLCPYSQSTMIALLEKQVPFQRIQLDMASKPQEFRDLYHAVIPLKDVKERVPLLLDGPTHLAESLVINEYLEARYKNQGARLMPDDAAAQARVRLFIQFFQDHVLPHYRRIVHVENPQIVEEAHQQLLAALEAVDAFLRLHGGSGAAGAVGPHSGFVMRDEDQAPQGAYFLGRQYSLAEVACTPWIARLALVLPEWRGMDVVQECRRVGADRAADWMAACLARASAARTDPTAADLIGGLVQAEAAHAL
ncbi:MAG: hypothetical protein J3K34DRAFT_398604 [Monoraphidium minutum]|nr:MAG: hypothetical protein J3K34DRAFT_398604 [Monoraphidium minutum]